MAETTLIAETFSFNDRATGAGAGRAGGAACGVRGNSILPTLKLNRLTDQTGRLTDRRARGGRRADRDRNSDYACEEEIPTAPEEKTSM